MIEFRHDYVSGEWTEWVKVTPIESIATLFRSVVVNKVTITDVNGKGQWRRKS